MTRPIFTPEYEEDESVILARMLGRVPEEWRKDPGDYVHDTIATSPAEVKQLQINQDNRLKNNFAQYAEKAKLDLKLAEVGLTRGTASPNKRSLQITADAGVLIPQDHTVISVIQDGDGNPLEFTVDAAVNFAVSGTQAVAITCKMTGAATNLANGTEFMLKPSLSGVRLIVDGGTTIPGTDDESDESAWNRYSYKITHPDTGGNKHDYVRWAQEVSGVGKVKTVPRWNGNNTVKVILLGSDNLPATPEVVADVQEYLDPGSTGLGDGKAPCGAKVTAVAATALAINVNAVVTYYGGYEESAKAAFNAALEAYLQSIAFVEIENDPEHDNVPVSIAKVGAMLISTEGVNTYSGLTLNGGTIDIPVPCDKAAVKGAVNI